MAAAYVSKEKFEASHPDALAVYCSDGRFTDAVEELLHSMPQVDVRLYIARINKAGRVAFHVVEER